MQEFEAAFAGGTFAFPYRASAKILRRPANEAPTTPTAPASQSGDGLADKEPRTSFYIVEAGLQPIEHTPSKRSLELLDFVPSGCCMCLPARLGMISKSPHYGLNVCYDGEIVEYTNALALVTTHRQSDMQAFGGGYQMAATVKCAYDENSSASLVSYCTLENSADFQLEPSWGQKIQMAFIVISDILQPATAEMPAVFLVDSIEKVDAEAMGTSPGHLARVIQFAKKVAESRHRSEAAGGLPCMLWTDERSPASLGKCRRLGKAPTDQMLEEYMPSPAPSATQTPA